MLVIPKFDFHASLIPFRALPLPLVPKSTGCLHTPPQFFQDPQSNGLSRNTLPGQSRMLHHPLPPPLLLTNALIKEFKPKENLLAALIGKSKWLYNLYAQMDPEFWMTLLGISLLHACINYFIIYYLFLGRFCPWRAKMGLKSCNSIWHLLSTVTEGERPFLFQRTYNFPQKGLDWFCLDHVTKLDSPQG